MRNRLILVLIISFFLSGCSYFNKTYVVEMDYPLPERKETSSNDGITVTSRNDLTEAIRGIVATGASNRTILFDTGYKGNPAEDLAAACWQVRTEDALCAYCVENIAYELSQIVTYTEARITIAYSKGALPVEEIITMPYATALNDRISAALSSGQERLAILISRSTLSAEAMTGRFSEVYEKNPGLAPVEPDCTVTLFSGSGTQRLYEINLNYGMSSEEYSDRNNKLASIVLPFEEDADELHKALTAADFLLDACSEDGGDTIYDALVNGCANSKGIALAYVHLCRQAGLDCRIVNGQRNWQDHYWNIVRIDSAYYHVDLFAGLEAGFLKSDTEFWGNYRWTINEYPTCRNKSPMQFQDYEADNKNEAES